MATSRAPQRESYPELNLIKAKAAMDKWPAAICVFEQDNRMIGQLFVAGVDEDTVTVRYIIVDRDLICNDWSETLATVTCSVHMDPYRRFLVCRCGKRVVSLYFKDNSWACGRCHGLHYRNQLIGKEVTLWEKRDRLQDELKGGRPKGMHNSTYVRRRQELLALDLELRGKSRKEASDVHNLRVTARWLPASEVRDFWPSDYTLRGREIVKVARSG